MTRMIRTAGFGFRAAATRASLEAALTAALAATDQRLPVSRLATAIDKANSPALQSLAGALAAPVVGVPLAELAAQNGARRSAKAPARYGFRSLAEASALAAAGPQARLLTSRCVSPDGLATVAIAEGSFP